MQRVPEPREEAEDGMCDKYLEKYPRKSYATRASPSLKPSATCQEDENMKSLLESNVESHCFVVESLLIPTMGIVAAIKDLYPVSEQC